MSKFEYDPKLSAMGCAVGLFWAVLSTVAGVFILWVAWKFLTLQL